MNVNVFVTRVNGELLTDLLVMPLAPMAPIPPKYRAGWVYFATVDTADTMFGDIDALAIETEIGNSGFAVVRPTFPDRR